MTEEVQSASHARRAAGHKNARGGRVCARSECIVVCCAVPVCPAASNVRLRALWSVCVLRCDSRVAALLTDHVAMASPQLWNMLGSAQSTILSLCCPKTTCLVCASP